MISYSSGDFLHGANTLPTLIQCQLKLYLKQIDGQSLALQYLARESLCGLALKQPSLRLRLDMMCSCSTSWKASELPAKAQAAKNAGNRSFFDTDDTSAIYHYTEVYSFSRKQ